MFSSESEQVVSAAWTCRAEGVEQDSGDCVATEGPAVSGLCPAVSGPWNHRLGAVFRSRVSPQGFPVTGSCTVSFSVECYSLRDFFFFFLT